MATYTKLKLSASTDGRGIKVTQTATAGDTIHTCSNDADVMDEVWLYAYNSAATAVNLTIEMGGVTAPDDNILAAIPSKTGLYLVVPGLVIKGNATPLVIKAFAATTNVVVIFGYVNRITV